MSKHSSAPISDFASSTLARASRPRRSRSKSIRFSQSTAIGPYVFSAISHLPCRATHRIPSKEAAILRLGAFCRAEGSLLLVPQNPTCRHPPSNLTPSRKASAQPQILFAPSVPWHLPTEEKMESARASPPFALLAPPGYRTRLPR